MTFIYPMRFFWLTMGHLAVAVGFIGIFLPVLPTTPFLILAAWAYSKGSVRFESWLLNHPVAGAPIRAWREQGVIPTRAKIISVFMMTISIDLSPPDGREGEPKLNFLIVDTST